MRGKNTLEALIAREVKNFIKDELFTQQKSFAFIRESVMESETV